MAVSCVEQALLPCATNQETHVAGAHQEHSCFQRGAGQVAGQVQIAAPCQAALRQVQAAALVLRLGWRAGAGRWRATCGALLAGAGRSTMGRQCSAGSSAARRSASSVCDKHSALWTSSNVRLFAHTF